MFQAASPLRLWSRVAEVIVVVYETFFCHVLCKLASWHWGGFEAGVYAGLIQCQRVEGGEHSNIWKDRNVIFTMQSQLGDTSTTREIWKFGRPSTTALVYSAIRQFNSSFAVSLSNAMASKLQAPRQRPQLRSVPDLHAFFWQFHQRSDRRWHIPSGICGSLCRHPAQCVVCRCCAGLSFRLWNRSHTDVLIVPPKPVISWPLK